MFSKLFKMLLHETTNVANTTAVTFNTSGTYNPKYGKQKVYVTGRGGTGTTVPGNYFSNASYTPAVYTPAYNIVTGSRYFGINAPSAGTYAGTVNSWYLTTYAYNTFDNNTYNSPAFGTPSNSSTYYAGQYIGPVTGPVPAPYSNPAWSGTGSNYAPVAASYTPESYYAGNSGTNATNYTTGTAANILGVTFPGGVGGVATVVPATAIANPKYGTATSITIPTGGYVTITFTL
jgi:hypothetical protein